MAKKFTFLIMALLGAQFFAQGGNKKTNNMVWFRYKDTPIVTMVNDLAKKRNINIMLPQGTNTLTSKVSFELPHKISLNKAWQYMITILNITGYTIIPDKECSFVVKNDTNISHEPLPLYINTPPQELPNTDLEIRYLRYLTVLQVPGANSSSGQGSLQSVFSQMLSPNYSVIYQPQLNAVVLTDTARNIKSVMTIINELEAAWPVEEPEFIKLKHTTASNVKTLLTSLIPGQSQNASSFGSTPTQTSNNSGYFTKGTSIVSEDRLNMLILLGKKEALGRIKEFIKKYIDIPQETGESILHVYELQYLKAENLAPILSQIVQSQANNSSNNFGGGYGSGTGQSTSTSTSSEFRDFQGVQITSEVGAGGDSGGSSTGTNTVSSGSQTGNRLIVAALKDDWVRIEKLIKELDKPQLQVIIHGLIVDLSYTALKDFGNQVRNYSGLFMRDVDWQAGNIGGIENTETTSSANPSNSSALQANLLPATSTNYSAGNIASNASAGSFIMSFKDPNTNGIWWVSSILSSHTDSKILSQPFLMTMNNKEVTFTDSVSRRIAGAASQQFGVEVSTQEDVTAKINLTVLPLINNNGRINLTIQAKINQFTGTNNAQLTRNITTNVNLYDKDILILGGLTKTKVENSIYKTPLLGDIPVIGNLFRKKNKTVTKTNLMIFLRPEIMTLNDNFISNRYFKKANQLLSGGEENFALLRDPITRWFFGKDPEGVTPKAIDKFRNENNNCADEPAIPMPKGRKESYKQKIQEPTVSSNKNVFKKPLPTPKLEAEVEEKIAEEELKRLFNWDDKDDIITQTNEDFSLEPLQDNEVFTATRDEGSQILKEAETILEEEQQAKEDLKKLFQNSNDFEQLIEQEN